jgi:hypothetical protein
MRFSARMALAGATLFLAAADAPPGGGPLAVTGEVAHPKTYTRAELAALPASSVKIDATGDNGPLSGTFSGPLLLTLVQQASPIDAPGKKTHYRHVLMVTGRDGYAVALALGEIDTHLEGKTVIVALRQDAKDLAAPRLVVPGDRRPPRFVKDVVGVEVK